MHHSTQTVILQFVDPACAAAQELLEGGLSGGRTCVTYFAEEGVFFKVLVMGTQVTSGMLYIVYS